MAVLSRFDELRSKTEHELLQLVHNALDLGLCEARLALKSPDTWEDHCLRANRAYSEASRLLPLVCEISTYERSRLEAQREQLREMLAGLTVLGSSPTREAIPTLARALWKARGCPEGSSEDDWFQAEQALKSHAVCMGN